jgi:predicted DNA-binding WGR domain protein
MAPGAMASARRTPKVSRISRGRTVAYARKQKPAGEGGGDGVGEDDPEDEPAATAPDEKPAQQPAAAGRAPDTAPSASSATPGSGASIGTGRPPPTEAGAAAVRPVAASAPASIAPWPDPVPPPTRPADPVRVQASTVAMPVQVSLGAPPAMPDDAAPPVRASMDVGSAEDPTRMPGPRELPAGNPDDPAAPPGYVPRGDSRSMRRRTDHYEFALIYRIQTYVISRFGKVGTRGQWRVVEYPTSASASHAYAKECSRFVSEGFSDYRA